MASRGGNRSSLAATGRGTAGGRSKINLLLWHDGPLIKLIFSYFSSLLLLLWTAFAFGGKNEETQIDNILAFETNQQSTNLLRWKEKWAGMSLTGCWFASLFWSLDSLRRLVEAPEEKQALISEGEREEAAPGTLHWFSFLPSHTWIISKKGNSESESAGEHWKLLHFFPR